MSCPVTFINREEDMEGLLTLLYDGFNGIVSSLDLARIFIALVGNFR